jgi:crotonobetainyl-CoA:carnitine CoA-transferase CaiB-like acyl-CoA transferase
MMALDGFKMLDLTRLLPGGYCSMLLADLGMEVVKVEDPFQGDYFRQMKPIHKEEGAYFLGINRNKKSMHLNLKTPEGKKIFFELAQRFDVILEGFRHGVVERLGIGYQAIRSINNRIIYCSISGYGQDGPYRKRSGHDINYIALAGLLAISGEKFKPPAIPPVPIADIGVGGTMSAFAILAALIAREKTGSGQYIDISMTDGMLSWLCMHMAKFFSDGNPPKRGEYEMGGASPCYNVYETLDSKYISIGILEPKFWANFCEALGREDLIPKQFSEGKERSLLFDEIRKIIRTKTRQEWEVLFKDIDACFEPVLEFDEVISHPQFLYREMFKEIDHPVEGKIKQIVFPIKFSETPGEIKTPPPLAGEHTELVLRSLGYSQSEIEHLKKQKVV